MSDRRKTPRAGSDRRLTPREYQVAALVAEARSNREIATLLCISPHTVGDHMKALLRKTETRTRLGVVLALQREDGP